MAGCGVPTFLLVLLLTLTLASAAVPGVSMAVTNKGLDYVNTVAGEALRTKLRTITIPDQSGREGSKEWWLNNIRVTGISGPDTRISLNPGANGLVLAVSNFGASLHADWRAKYRIIFRISSSGSVDLSISGASVTAVVRLGENNRYPTVQAQSCDCQINDVGIKFHGGLAAFILNLFRGYIRGKVRDLLREKVCQQVNELINTRANAELTRMKVNAEVARRFILDYSLSGAPVVTANYLEAPCKGAVYWKDNRQESPFTPEPMPALTDFSRMLCVRFSEYSAKSFLYVAHTNRFLIYNITLDKLPPGAANLLNPTPQLETKFPNSKLELHIYSSEVPNVQFENQQLTTTAAANVEIVVRSPDRVVTPLVLKVSVSVTVEPSVVNGRLRGIISGYTFHINVIKSDIGEINEEEFNTLIRQAIDTVVLPGLNEYGENGIDLPVTGILRLYNTQLSLQTGVLLLCTDVEYLK